MPQTEKITVNYNRKVQLNDFEPVQHGVTLEVSLDEGDDPDEVYDEYSERSEEMVERALAERIARSKIDAESDE